MHLFSGQCADLANLPKDVELPLVRYFYSGCGTPRDGTVVETEVDDDPAVLVLSRSARAII